MKNYCGQLVSIGGEPLLDCLPSFNQTILNLTGKLSQEFQKLLSCKNGFYCFESALHIFPSGDSSNIMTLEHWNSHELWKKYYGSIVEKCLFFAEDIFGGQFCILENKICSFDPETGDVEKIADNFETWAKCIMDEYDFLTGYSLAHDWQKKHGAMPSNTRLLPKIPFVCGGKFELSNLYLLDSIKGMELRADLARQIRNSPDGTKIKFTIVE